MSRWSQRFLHSRSGDTIDFVDTVEHSIAPTSIVSQRVNSVTKGGIGKQAPEWTVEDWLAFFDERAGIIEFDGGEDRPRAEYLAFESCIARYCELHGVATRQDAARALIAFGLPPAPERSQ